MLLEKSDHPAAFRDDPWEILDIMALGFVRTW